MSGEGARKGRIEPYHDRVRETVLLRMDPDRKRACHVRLAAAMESVGEDNVAGQESLVRHLVGAGELARAALHAERAATQALRALAFDQAADLYRIAIAHHGGDASSLHTLRVALADTLANGARGHEAADAYLACLDGADASLRMEYQRRAADHLLRSGYLERGTAILASVLAEYGAKLPRTPLGALARVALGRARLRLRGLAWTPKDASAIPSERLRRIDAFHATAISLSLIDTARGGVFQARALSLALDAGEPTRLGRSLTMDACYVASTGTKGIAYSRRALEEVRKIHAMTNDPYLRACVTMVDAYLDYHAGDFLEADPKFTLAERQFREDTRGSYFEAQTCRWIRLVTLRNRGAIGALDAGFSGWARDAERRGDRFGEASIRLNLNCVWLARDNPDEARRDLARTEWSPPKGGGYHMQHWYEHAARGEIDLYTGEANLARFRPFMAGLGRSFIGRMRLHRCLARWLLGRLLLSQASRQRNPGRMLGEVARLADQLDRENVGFARTWSLLLRGAIASRQGDEPRAVRLLEETIREAGARNLPQCREAARFRLGQLISGDAGKTHITTARKWLENEAIVRPERMVDVWAPGYALTGK